MSNPLPLHSPDILLVEHSPNDALLTRDALWASPLINRLNLPVLSYWLHADCSVTKLGNFIETVRPSEDFRLEIIRLPRQVSGPKGAYGD